MPPASPRFMPSAVRGFGIARSLLAALVAVEPTSSSLEHHALVPFRSGQRLWRSAARPRPEPAAYRLLWQPFVLFASPVA